MIVRFCTKLGYILVRGQWTVDNGQLTSDNGALSNWQEHVH